MSVIQFVFINLFAKSRKHTLKNPGVTTLLSKLVLTRFSFYKNNFIRTTRLKFAQKLRTSKEQLRLGFRCKFNCKFLLKNTSRHYMWRFIADLSAVE